MGFKEAYQKAQKGNDVLDARVQEAKKKVEKEKAEAKKKAEEEVKEEKIKELTKEEFLAAAKGTKWSTDNLDKYYEDGWKFSVTGEGKDKVASQTDPKGKTRKFDVDDKEL